MGDHQATCLGIDRLLETEIGGAVAPALAELMFSFVVLTVANQQVCAGGHFDERAVGRGKRLIIGRKDQRALGVVESVGQASAGMGNSH